MKLPMLTNSNNKESASFTMAFLGFNSVLLWFLLYLFSGIGHYQVPEFSGSDAMLFLSPLLTLYFVGKNKKLDNSEKEE